MNLYLSENPRRSSSGRAAVSSARLFSGLFFCLFFCVFFCLLFCPCFSFSALADTVSDAPVLFGGSTAGASAPDTGALISAPPDGSQTAAQSGSGSGVSGGSVSDIPLPGEPEGQVSAENKASLDGAGTGRLVPSSAPTAGSDTVPPSSAAAAGTAAKPVLEPQASSASEASAAGTQESLPSALTGAPLPETETAVSAAADGTQAELNTNGSREIPAGPVTGTDTMPAAAAPKAGSTAAAGSVHANDAASRVWLDFFLISPNHVKGNLRVTRGALQLSDGSWQELDYADTVRRPFYRMLSRQTGSDGRSWYIAAAHARRFGSTCSEDGETKTELWLDASDCISRNYIDINTTNAKRTAIVKAALALLGKQYVYGGTGPEAFDCSGFVQYVMKEAGITVPRTSTELLDLDGQITAAELRPGDILARPGHCGIYIGNDVFIHASDSSVGVVAENLSVYNQTNKFTGWINAVGD